MNAEQIKKAVNNLTEVWNAIRAQILEMANALEKIFKRFVIYPNRDIKECDKSLRRRHHRMVTRYNYIPKVPRNLPYMKRIY